MTIADAEGTCACPICGWGQPHAHTTEEIAERPIIEWARTTFESLAREYLLHRRFDHERVGFMWAFEAENARRAGDWAERSHPTGPYRYDFVQRMWEFWRIAWMASRSNLGVIRRSPPLRF